MALQNHQNSILTLIDWGDEKLNEFFDCTASEWTATHKYSSQNSGLTDRTYTNNEIEGILSSSISSLMNLSLFSFI